MRHPLLLFVLATGWFGLARGGDCADAIEARVDAIFAEWNRKDAPGCAVGVAKDGELVFSRAYGMSNLDLGAPLTPDSVFDICSTSKQFTAAAIMLLAEEGKLALEDDVRKHVPELPEYGKAIRIRHLIHHTSGLRDYLALASLAGDAMLHLDQADALKIIARQRALNFPPGEDYSYSNSGYVLLAIIAERASGKPFAEFTRERIFAPLGMEKTFFETDAAAVVPGRAMSYTGGGKNPKVFYKTLDSVGDGNLMTTALDLAKWDRNFYENKLGSGTLVPALLARGKFDDGTEISYAGGLFHGKYRGLPFVDHGGAFAGFRTQLMRFAEQRFSVIVLCNSALMDPDGLARKVADVYLEEAFKSAEAAEKPKEEQPAFAAEPEKLKEIEGSYRNPVNGSYIRLAPKDGKLVMSNMNGSLEFAPIGPGRFRAGSAASGSVLEYDSAAREARFISNLGRVRTLERIEMVRPSEAELNEFTGAYYSPEVDAVLWIELEKGRLHLARAAADKIVLRPTVKDGLQSVAGSLDFERDAAGKLAGFKISNDRAMNVAFKRIDP